MAAPVAAALPCATTQSRLSPATAGPKTELGHLESPSGSEWGGLPQRSQRTQGGDADRSEAVAGNCLGLLKRDI